MQPTRDRGIGMPGNVGVGLIGSRFISSIHAAALKAVSNAEVRGVVSPSAGHARDFAQQHGIPHHFTDLDQMLARDDIDMVVVGAPNVYHCDITLRAAQAGKHVVIEKPMALNMGDKIGRAHV